MSAIDAAHLLRLPSVFPPCRKSEIVVPSLPARVARHHIRVRQQLLHVSISVLTVFIKFMYPGFLMVYAAVCALLKAPWH